LCGRKAERTLQEKKENSIEGQAWCGYSIAGQKGETEDGPRTGKGANMLPDWTLERTVITALEG
jgi:hypothetical protein